MPVARDTTGEKPAGRAAPTDAIGSSKIEPNCGSQFHLVVRGLLPGRRAYPLAGEGPIRKIFSRSPMRSREDPHTDTLVARNSGRCTATNSWHSRAAMRPAAGARGSVTRAAYPAGRSRHERMEVRRPRRWEPGSFRLLRRRNDDQSEPASARPAARSWYHQPCRGTGGPVQQGAAPVPLPREMLHRLRSAP